MNQEKYIGMDVHQATISVAVMDSSGKLIMECILETKAATILEFIAGLRGTLSVTFEEGTSAAWLHDLLKPHVARVVVCDPRKNALLKDGSKSDRIDARKLAELLRGNQLHPVYHGEHGVRTLKELGRSYLTLTQDVSRVMTRIKALYRGWAIPCRRREQWLPVVFSVLDVGKNIDIVVLAAPKPLLAQALPSVPIGDDLMLGDDCQFIGFPYGGGWRFTLKTDEKEYWFPFTKHCNVSGFAGGYDGEPRLLVLDGINNEGFSGGPVLSHTGAEQRIVAVISGYHTESAEVIAAVANRPNMAPAPEKHRKQVANVNSGFILAFGMQFAIDAIQKNPIGPLRP